LYGSEARFIIRLVVQRAVEHCTVIDWLAAYVSALRVTDVQIKWDGVI
jgi:hypothetical protein